MKIWKLLILVLMALIMTTQMACSESFMGKSAEDVFHDPKAVQLIHAAESSEDSRIKQLLAEGANINAKGENGMTPSLWMLSIKDYDGLRLLLENGADPNAMMDDSELSLVHIAAATRPTEVLALILKHGGNPNLTFKMNDDTPLMAAIWQFRFDNADYLIKHGADINQHTTNGLNAPGTAITIGQYDYALKLLKLGYNNNLVDLAKDAEIRQVSAEGEPDRQKVITFLKNKLGPAYPKMPTN